MMLFLPNIELTDLDGHPWHLSAPGCPLRLRTITGLEGAEWSFDTTTGVGQPGVTVIARDDKESYVEMTLWVGPVSPGNEAVGLLRQVLHGLGRGWSRDGRLMRLLVMDTGRYQQVRLAARPESPNWAVLHDIGRCELKLKLQSDESWWRTDPIDETLTMAQASTYSFTSLGDEASWPYFKITGPISGPQVGLNGELVTLPSAIPSGQSVTIETDPDWWSVKTSGGTDLTWSTGDRWYKKAVPGVNTARLLGTGTNSNTRLQLVVPQLFHGAL